MRLLAIVSAVWVASELVVAFLRHSESGEKRSDRGSLFLLWLVIGGGIFAASRLRGIARMPYRHVALDIGIALIVAGIVIRAIAIATLWRYFSVDVTIRSDQQIVQHGIYAHLRHPAYTGSLLAFIGLGIAFGSWLSLAIIAVLTIGGMSYRIAVEERALTEHFGDAYHTYSSHTKRLIPGIY
jgi:protein-S-isoprenylcysteine O-methyltransferase Ste14